MKLPFSKISLAASFLVLSIAAGQERSLTLAEAKAEFKKADAALNKAYQDVKESIPDWAFEKLKEEQKSWLEYRDERAMTDATFNGGQQFSGKEKEAPDYWESLTWNTGTRTSMVKGWKLMANQNREIPLSGLWTDGYGGWLRIAVADKVAGAASLPTASMAFFLEVVRGPTYHMGEISGNAKLNDSMAFFTDAGTDDGEKTAQDGETWLVFEKLYNSPQLELKGVNTQSYHGARAYFNGTYTRVGDLEEGDRKKMLNGEFDFNEER